MYLHSLLINGFKSFPEAKIQFPKGVTAVVGPNGTGKSNIVDAILWALGEQSPKTLRGERMEDVIFNGTEHRKPVGMAEVSLILGDIASHELEALAGATNGAGLSNDIMITRRLYRDGESEYLINQIPVRLKDIRSFLWAARAGAKGHTVIEQGNLDQLLNASPQERREFVEATAGITKYKKQKAEALRKLEATEHNLMRVRDILSEVRRQLRSLERQAKHAQEYQALKADARALELKLVLHEYRALAHQQHTIQQELAEAEAQELALLAKETQILAEHEQAKLSLSELSDTMQAAQDRRRHIEHAIGQSLTTLEITKTRIAQFEQQHDHVMQERSHLTSQIDHTEQTIRTLDEGLTDLRREIDQCTHSLQDAEAEANLLAAQRAEANDELERARYALIDVTVEKTNADNRRRSLEEQRQSLGRRIERLMTEHREWETRHEQHSSTCAAIHTQRTEYEQSLAGLHAQCRDIDHRLDELQQQRQQLDSHLVHLQTTLAGKASTVRALQAIVREAFGYDPDGTIDHGSLRGTFHTIQGALGERLEVPAHLERAVEAVLSDWLKAWIVEYPDEAARGLDFLKSRPNAHGHFLILDAARAHAIPTGPWWEAIRDDPTVIGRATELIGVPEEWKPFSSALFDRIVFVHSLDAALHLMDRHQWFHGEGPIVVTLEGDTIHPCGMLTGGAPGRTEGILSRRREIAALEEQIDELTRQITETQHTKQSLMDQLADLQSARVALEADIDTAEMRLVEAKKEAAAHEQALLESARRLETLAQERAAEQTELDRLATEQAEAERRFADLCSQESAHEDAVHSAERRLHDIDEQVRAVTTRITDIRLALGAHEARWRHDQETRTRLEQDNATRRERIARLDHQLEQVFLRSRENQEERIQTEIRLDDLKRHKQELDDELAVIDGQYQTASSRVQELDRQLRDIRERIAAVLKARGAIDIRLAEVRTKLQTIETTLTETYNYPLHAHQSPIDANGFQPASEDAESGSPEHWQEELQAVRRKLERIGAVNLTAIDEHRELEKRHRFLAEQEEDLTKSIQSLQEIIQRLNQTTNQLFTETFRMLQEKFNEVFTALFAGGRAELVLVSPEEEEPASPIQREPGVEIIAQPPGKRLKNLAMLSGGEKTLTVLALLFASFLIKPSPFCILDEVDAPLDETNVARFSQFMRQMANQSQFIVITHNKRTMETADSLFGVTMEEPGVSKLVSVKLTEWEQVA